MATNFFAGREVQKLPARLISSELRAHQMSPSGESSRTRPHGRHQLMSCRIVRCTYFVQMELNEEVAELFSSRRA